MIMSLCVFFFFFQAEDGIRDVAVTGVQTVCSSDLCVCSRCVAGSIGAGSSVHAATMRPAEAWARTATPRSEEHTSELQSRLHLVCRLLLEKKKHGGSLRVSRS